MKNYVLGRWIMAGACALVFGIDAQAQGWLLPSQGNVVPVIGSPAGKTSPDLPAIVRDAAGAERLRPSDRPFRTVPLGQGVVITGFSGTTQRMPAQPADRDVAPASPQDLTFIDPDGVSAVVLGAGDLGGGFDAAEVVLPRIDTLLSRDIGQVFGVALGAGTPGIGPDAFLTASSVYGLALVGPDANGDRVPDRLKQGNPEARWMPGLWGPGVNAGPGAVWRLDAASGQVGLFATLPVGAASLGNIAYEKAHAQLFVSDLDRGLILRLNLAGEVVQEWDHGMTGRRAVGLSAVPDDGVSREAQDDALDLTAPATWGFTDPARRVWGLATHGGRLFYAVADGPTVWSVGIAPMTGALMDDARLEYRFATGTEISDIAIAPNGALILAERPALRPDPMFEQVTEGAASLRRLVQEWPNDPQTPFSWIEDTAYDAGFAGMGKTALGGVALGPRYDQRGRSDAGACAQTLWATGDSLRASPDTLIGAALRPLGAEVVDGVSLQPVARPDTGNSPPWLSLFADFDGLFPDTPRAGLVGDVAASPCADGPAVGGGYPPVTWSVPDGPGGSDGDDDDPDGPDFCTVFPWLCSKGPQSGCMITAVEAVCNPTTGEVELSGVMAGTVRGLTRAKLDWDTGGAEIDLPGALALGIAQMAQGQRGQVSVCAYDPDQATSGQPYDCCNAVLEFTAPACEKEAQ